jgi:hypothetical protein
MKRTDADATGLTVMRAQSVALTNGSTSVAVSFATVMPDATYSVTYSITNTTDSSVLFQPTVTTLQTAGGFVAKWNAPLDSVNYILSYIAIWNPQSGTGFRAQSVALTTATTSVAITFSTALPSASYSITAVLKNTTDSSIYYQPITVTFQDASGFVARWNVPLETGNYYLSYVALTYV